MTHKDGWVAVTSDNKTHTEEWISGGDSPWSSLMKYCKDHKAHVVSLRLSIADQIKALPANEQGYWQAHSVSATTTGEQRLARGIGYVSGTKCNIIWGMYTESGHSIFWQETRAASDKQIIWNPYALSLN